MKKLYIFTLLSFAVMSSLANENPNLEAVNCAEEATTFDGGGGFEFPENALYAMAVFTGGTNDVGLYDYNPDSDDITYDPSYIQSTGAFSNFSLDYNPSDGTVYILTESGATRSVGNFDMATGTITIISAAVSTTGNNQPHAMAFGPDGTLYIAFKSGEIQIYDLGTGTTSEFANVGSGPPDDGGVGMTFDFDNNRLVYASGSFDDVNLLEIDLGGTVSDLFTISAPCGPAQGMEYVGNNKIISTGTFGCNTIWTIDLLTGNTVEILSPTGFASSLKDLMYISKPPFEITCEPGAITISPDDFVATATGADVLAEDFPEMELYAMNPFLSGVDNLFKLSYNNDTDAIAQDTDYLQSTGSGGAFAFDFNAIDQQVYFLGSATGGGRGLFTFNLETGDRVELGPIESVGGSTNPQAMAFAKNGSLYFVFNTGEVNRYNVNSGVMSEFTTVPTEGGAVGLTYDYDNDRLLHARGTGVATISAIDLGNGTVDALFNLAIPTGDCSGTAQGIEYVGNNKILASTTSGCSSIYVVDLDSFIPQKLLDPDFTDDLKSLMYIHYDINITPNNFSCDDLGDFDVVVTVTDPFGREAECETTVNVSDPDNNCALSVDDLAINAFSMYPNPAQDFVTLAWGTDMQATGLELYDFTGKQLLNMPVSTTSELTLDLSGYAPGVYLIRVFVDQTVETKKLVIR